MFQLPPNAHGAQKKNGRGLTDQMRAPYDMARSLYPLLPTWYEETDACITPEFQSLNGGGLPIFCVPPGYTLMADEGAHEAGHAYLALLSRAQPAINYGQAYWAFRGFPGTFAGALVGSQAETVANVAWQMDPRESWAEAFARSVVITHNEKTLNWGMDKDPLALRAWFQSLNPAALPPKQKEPAVRTMYDSTNANDIPATATMVAGYVDGAYRWSDADWARFPGAVKVRIAVFAPTNDGHVGDVETGAMAPHDAPWWAHQRRLAGVDPTVYVNLANAAAVRAAFDAAGEPQPHYWLASYDNNPTIPPGYIAKQYANEPLAGGHYDLSVVADYWPGVDGEEVTQDEFNTMASKWWAEVAQGPQTLDAMKAAYNPLVSHQHDTPAGKTSLPKQP